MARGDAAKWALTGVGREVVRGAGGGATRSVDSRGDAARRLAMRPPMSPPAKPSSSSLRRSAKRGLVKPEATLTPPPIAMATPVAITMDRKMASLESSSIHQ